MLTKKELFIIIAIITVVVVGFGLLFTFSTRPELNIFPVGIEPEDVPEIDPNVVIEEPVEVIPTTTTGLLIPETVHSYTGTVSEVGEDHVILLLSSNENYVEEDMYVRVVVGDTTEVLQLTFPEVIPEGAVRVDTESSSITLQEIEKGDTLEVYSSENIVGKRSFEAKRIQKIEL